MIDANLLLIVAACPCIVTLHFLFAGQCCRLLWVSVKAEYTSRVDDHDDRDVCTH